MQTACVCLCAVCVCVCVQLAREAVQCHSQIPHIVVGNHILSHVIFMHSTPNIVGKGIMFSDCLSICLFIRPDRCCYHSISWTARAISMKHIRNIHQSLLMTFLVSGGQRLKVKVTAGHRGGEGIHVNAGVLKSHLLIFWFFIEVDGYAVFSPFLFCVVKKMTLMTMSCAHCLRFCHLSDRRMAH